MEAAHAPLPRGSVVVMSQSDVIFTLLFYALPIALLVAYHRKSTRWYSRHMGRAFGPDWTHHSPVTGLRAANQQVTRGTRLPTLQEHPEEESNEQQEKEEEQQQQQHCSFEREQEDEVHKSRPFNVKQWRQQQHQQSQKGQPLERLHKEEEQQQQQQQQQHQRGSSMPCQAPHHTLFRSNLTSPMIAVPAALAAGLAVPLGLAGGLVGGVCGMVGGVTEMVTSAAYGAAAGGIYPFHLLGLLADENHLHRD